MNISSIGNGVPRASDRPRAGGVIGQLRALAQSDPTKLKKVAGDMAATLRADAQKASGDAATALTKLADGLDKVAQTGDLSALAPQKGASGAHGPKHHHGHHRGAGGAPKSNGDATNANDPFSEVRSDLLQAFTAALDAANQPVPAPMPPTPTST